MRIKTDLIRRVEFSIPNNENTRSVLDEIKRNITKYFGGAIEIRSQLGGFWLDENDELYIEDIVLFIIYYESEEYPEAEEMLKYLAKILIKTGEKESWIIYQDAKRIIYSN